MWNFEGTYNKFKIGYALINIFYEYFNMSWDSYALK
jgi:hypothetical protein